jgi:AMP-binding enzyme
VDIGVGTGASIEADPRALRTDVSQRAITEYILDLADGAGYAAALIDADPETPENPEVDDGIVTTWQQFAYTVRAAARGLGRRGLRHADTVGVFVEDAASHTVAVHAVQAAGAIASSIPPAAPPADIAAQLKACRARLLITSATLAELAIQAAERSLVRQVFAFGEAAGTIPFRSLLEAAKHAQFHHNGSTHTASGRITAHLSELAGLGADGPGPRLTRRDVVVAGPPCGDPGAYQSLLDLALVAGATIVAAPLPQIPAAIYAYRGTAAIVPRGTHVPAIPAERVFTVG